MVASLNQDLSANCGMRYAESNLPTRFGDFRCIIFRLQDGHEHVALVKGEVENQSSVLLRLQSECLTSEVFGSLKCDCKEQLDLAMAMIEKEGCGILLYLRQEGRGIGLGNKIRAYSLQEDGVDTVDANRILGFPDDGRDFCCAVRIIRDLGVQSVRLLTNNPKKVDALVNAGIHVVERLPHLTDIPKAAQEYMRVKKTRMGHFISCNNEAPDGFDPIVINGGF